MAKKNTESLSTLDQGSSIAALSENGSVSRSSRERLRIAIQKSGRLNERSLFLLQKCGVSFDMGIGKARLLYQSTDFPMDLMLVRDDDIPEYVFDGVCDLGIVGLNILQERLTGKARATGDSVRVMRELGFGRCRLSIAVPSAVDFAGPQFLNGKRIATSYPSTLNRFLKVNGIKAEIVELSGSVEIAPALQVADAVCDLVSTGGTLSSNGLKEVLTILQSQAVLISSQPETGVQRKIERLLQRIDGVLLASESKYIMMNAPRSALPSIRAILPGMEDPSILPLSTLGERVAIHAVARETIFWETIEKLKAVGASSILVLPIEKIVA